MPIDPARPAIVTSLSCEVKKNAKWCTKYWNRNIFWSKMIDKAFLQVFLIKTITQMIRWRLLTWRKVGQCKRIKINSKNKISQYLRLTVSNHSFIFFVSFAMNNSVVKNQNSIFNCFFFRFWEENVSFPLFYYFLNSLE